MREALPAGQSPPLAHARVASLAHIGLPVSLGKALLLTLALLLGVPIVIAGLFFALIVYLAQVPV